MVGAGLGFECEYRVKSHISPCKCCAVKAKKLINAKKYTELMAKASSDATIYTLNDCVVIVQFKSLSPEFGSLG